MTSGERSAVERESEWDVLLSSEERIVVRKQREGAQADIQQVCEASEADLLSLSPFEEQALRLKSQATGRVPPVNSSRPVTPRQVPSQGRGDTFLCDDRTQALAHTDQLPPVDKLAALVRRGELSAQQVLEDCLSRIPDFDAQVNSFITLDTQGTRAAAKAIDEQVQAGGDPGPLAGVPVAVKDMISTRELRTTGSCRLFEDRVPEYDAEVIGALRDAGAVIVGKNNLNELGWSLPSDENLTPPPRNPWNLDYNAVGSSSGLGAAAAAGFCSLAIGTDEGGSTRLPAGQTGLVGLKPTRGGLPYESIVGGGMLSSIGLLARQPEEVLYLWDALQPGNKSSAAQSVRPSGRERTLGIPAHVLNVADIEPAVRDASDLAVETLRVSDVRVPEVQDIDLDLARAAALLVLKSEKSSTAEYLMRADPNKIGRSARMYAAASLGLSVSNHHWALRVGSWFQGRVDRVLRHVHGLLMPTSPVVTAEAARGPGRSRGMSSICTAPFDLSGHPAVSVPTGMCGNTGLPIGVQIVGAYGAERHLLDISLALRGHNPWSAGKRPGSKGSHSS